MFPYSKIAILCLAALALGACERKGGAPEHSDLGAVADPHGGVLLVADVAPEPRNPAVDGKDDLSITARVTAALAADATLADQRIKVHTQAGIVSLRGTVYSLTAVRRASAIAMAVEGVAGVDNRLNLMVSN